ncbi:MAG TPA: hypothetical protein VNZ03_00650 [Terriglobales bacterium]|nr:hypothetical protein [Terriglobales bacterium]
MAQPTPKSPFIYQPPDAALKRCHRDPSTVLGAEGGNAMHQSPWTNPIDSARRSRSSAALVFWIPRPNLAAARKKLLRLLPDPSPLFEAGKVSGSLTVSQCRPMHEEVQLF